MTSTKVSVHWWPFCWAILTSGEHVSLVPWDGAINLMAKAGEPT